MWNRTVLSTLRNHIDYIALHTYISNRDNDLEKFLAWSQTIDYYIEVTEGQINEVRRNRADARPIYIAYDEWNVWYRAGEKEQLEEIYNFEDVLAMGMFFNSFFRHANIVKMANLAQLVNVIAPIMTNKQGLFLQPIYFPIAEYGKQLGAVSLDAWGLGPVYKLEKREPLSYLDVSVTYDRSKKIVCVNVLNRSKDKDITTAVESQSNAIGQSVGVWEMNYTDLKATHIFGDDRKIVPATRTFSAEVVNNTFSYTFPAHSLTILTLNVQ